MFSASLQIRHVYREQQHGGDAWLSGHAHAPTRRPMFCFSLVFLCILVC